MATIRGRRFTDSRKARRKRGSMELSDILPRFLEEPGGHIVLDSDLCVCEVGPEFLRLTKHQRNSIMYRHFASIITEPNPRRHSEMLGAMRAGIAIVVKTGDTVKLPIRRCDIVPSDGTGVEQKWWRIALVPIKVDGEVKWIACRFEDVSIQMITSYKIANLRRSNYSLYALAVILMGAIAWGIQTNNSEFTKVSQRTCQVQSSYLGSTQPLAHVMRDINKILVIPQPSGQPPPSHATRVIVRNMQSDLNSYLKITANLPAGRKCNG